MAICLGHWPRKLLLFSSLCWVFSSCVNTKKAIYFREQGDGAIRSSSALPETLIQSNDILSIQVSSLNQDASSAFNVANREDVTATTLSGSRNETSGYLVGPEGYISFPILGDIHAAGLTKSQLTDTIARMLNDRKLLVD